MITDRRYPAWQRRTTSHRQTRLRPRWVWRTWQLAPSTHWWKPGFFTENWISPYNLKNIHPIGWAPGFFYLFYFPCWDMYVCLSSTSPWWPSLKQCPWRTEVRAVFMHLEDYWRVKRSFCCFLQLNFQYHCNGEAEFFVTWAKGVAFSAVWPRTT